MVFGKNKNMLCLISLHSIGLICKGTNKGVCISAILWIINIVSDIFAVVFSSLILYCILVHAVKTLFLFGIQNFHDLIVPGSLLFQLGLLCKRLIDQLFLFCQILPSFADLMLPQLYSLVHGLHLSNQMADHVGGVTWIGIETVCMIA